MPTTTSFSILVPLLNGFHCSLGHGFGAGLVPKLGEPVLFVDVQILGNALGSVLRVRLVLVEAVFDSPLGIFVTAGDVVLGEGRDGDVGPLAGLRSSHLEGESGLVCNLKGLLSIVEENLVTQIRVLKLESVVSTDTDGTWCLVATIRESKEFALGPPELLVGIIPNPFLEATAILLAVED